MRYRYADLLALAPQDPTLLQRAVTVGRFDRSHVYLELPDNFAFTGPAPEPVHVVLGFGDLVAGLAQPIARGLDAVLGTDLQNCGGCKDRQEALNDKLPFK